MRSALVCPRRRPAAVMRSAAVLAAAVSVALALAPVHARADGDPASDVLSLQGLFLPPDAGASASQQARLNQVVRAAAAGGFAIRVAVIASPSDLGSIGALWRQPQRYAEFLGQELSLVYPGQVLVVMPNGFGLYHVRARLAAEQAALARSPLAGRAGGLAASAIQAVQNLAQSTSHALPRSAAGRPAAAIGRRSGDTLSWVIFAAGMALVGLAWAASVRARPLRRPRSPAAPS